VLSEVGSKDRGMSERSRAPQSSWPEASEDGEVRPRVSRKLGGLGADSAISGKVYRLDLGRLLKYDRKRKARPGWPDSPAVELAGGRGLSSTFWPCHCQL